MTWTEIIELLKQVAAATDVFLLPDIAQLEGYCNKLDSDAFVHFLQGIYRRTLQEQLIDIISCG